MVSPFDESLDDGFGYYLTTHPEALSDTAVALFRSWLIERFGTGANAPGGLATGGAPPGVHLAVSNE